MLYIIVSVCLTLFAGLMSGLTLGLMSLDKVDLEVLRRSGTPTEKKHAARITPVLSSPHLLLVTLLLCNAAAMEALPIFIDKLLSPAAAIILSVTAVLFFGEIIPQAVCSRYGLAVGAYSAWFVRGLMLVCWPVSWPISKVLDAVLGHEQTALFRRGQLKALVDIHGAQSNLGGDLTSDEISVIRGALDLTNKTARSECTPLNKVFMLSTDTELDEEVLTRVLRSGHSRVPVHQPGDRSAILGVVLVKELILLDPQDKVRVDHMRIRRVPFLPADTPMYDLLRLFKTGRSHMVFLTKPAGLANGMPPGDPNLQVISSPSKDQPQQPEEGVAVAVDEQIIEAAAPSCYEDSAEPGDVIGLITIEDVVETLIGDEILDETDRFIDNERTQRVDSMHIPERLRAALGPSPTKMPSLRRSRTAAEGTMDDAAASSQPLLRDAMSEADASEASCGDPDSPVLDTAASL